MRKLLIIFLSCFICQSAISQVPDSLINRYDKYIPTRDGDTTIGFFLIDTAAFSTGQMFWVSQYYQNGDYVIEKRISPKPTRYYINQKRVYRKQYLIAIASIKRKLYKANYKSRFILKRK